MTNIRWNASYSVGVKELDGQHQELIRIINRIPTEPPGRDQARVLAGVLKALHDYAATHFSTEEEYMRRIFYPLLAAHAAQHKHFQENILERIRQYRDSHVLDHEGLLRFLVEWLIDHILEADGGYASHARGRG